MSRVVCYQRVSTQQQGRSGLGLAAQTTACKAYAASVQAGIIGTYVEVETGTNKRIRPELIKALAHAELTGATLVIASITRLSRNASFLMALKDAGVNFIAADMPQANDMTVGIMALVAQNEAEAISKRTKDALQAAKTRGTKLGNPNGAAALKRADKGNTAALSVIKAGADSHAKKLEPVIEGLKQEGIVSLGNIAKALNERGMLTPRGGNWYKTSVANLLARLA